MKIGIVTFWWSEDNYGQLLQCYALQKYLRDQGHDAFLIRYDPRKEIIGSSLFSKFRKALNPFNLFSFIHKFIKSKISIIESSRNPRYFSDFRSQYLHVSETLFTTYEELKQHPPFADIYIVGSDQVWNFGNQQIDSIRNIIHAYFLDFGSHETKRVSYAASWSMITLDPAIAYEIKALLSKFDYVSVREKAGLNICESLGINAEWVPDPTLLLSSETYRSMYRTVSINLPKKPYIFLYLLSNESFFPVNHIFKWAKKNNLDICYITGNSNVDKYPKYYATIPQWLYLLDNAKYIITNSFHCCVFSFIFQKQFAVIPLKGSHLGMNSRLESFWELTHISPRYLLKDDFSILTKHIEYRKSYKFSCSLDKFL